MLRRKRFYLDGVRVTGMNTITSEAGIAKKSLYNNFSSKAELVSTYIEARHEEWLGLYRKLSAKTSTAGERVVAVFDSLHRPRSLPAWHSQLKICNFFN